MSPPLDRTDALDMVERQGEQLVQIVVTIEGTRLFQLKQDLARQHQARRDHERAAGELSLPGQVQGEGDRRVPAPADDLFGEPLRPAISKRRAAAPAVRGLSATPSRSRRLQ